MNLSGPGYPALRIAQAYGVRPPQPARPASAAPLVAARVPAAVDFAPPPSEMPRQVKSPARFALYNRSADINEVATGVALGRSVDIRG